MLRLFWKKHNFGRESRVEDKTTGIRTFKTYDGMGRLAKVSVPQVDDTDSYAWTLNGCEASPRNMLVMKTLPGQLWHSQNKSSKTVIYTNQDGRGSGNVHVSNRF